jgi:hypothetical protein
MPFFKQAAAVSVLCAFLLLPAAYSFGEMKTSPEAADLSPESARGQRISPEMAEGLSIATVTVHLDGSTGDQAGDEDLKQWISARAAVLQGGAFQQFIVDGTMNAIRELSYVESSTYSVYESTPRGQVVLVIEAVATSLPGAPPTPEGVMVSHEREQLPILFKDDRSLFKVIFNGGAGGYSSKNPFFGHADLFTRGNIAARDPAGPGTTAWAEGYVELGLGGITRLFDSPMYGYGAATYLESFSWGQDLYDSGNRQHGDFEQLYAGFIYDLPGEGKVLNFSAGKQIYQLRQGFLISKIPGSTNLGPYGALWLGPRLAYDRTIVAKMKLGKAGLEGILLEPTEFSGMETDTRVAAGTVSYKNDTNVDAALTYLYVPRSDKSYFSPDGTVLATREGIRTCSPSLWLTSPFGVDGLWFKGELAYQDHEQIDMSAYAYAAWVGYDATTLPWQPGISYRYSSFSGDDPETTTYERYDPLFSGGQHNYTPGMLLSSVLINANLQTHKITLTAKPSDVTSLTLEYSMHRANHLNNRGAIGPMQVLQSEELAREVDLFFNAYIGENFYLQCVLAAAVPGSAITQALGGREDNWYAAQVSLYWFF